MKLLGHIYYIVLMIQYTGSLVEIGEMKKIKKIHIV